MRRWMSESVPTGQLARRLNDIEKDGGAIFSVFDDGERRSNVCIVFYIETQAPNPKGYASDPKR